VKVSMRVVLSVDAEKWAENNNGTWPQDDKRSLATAVRVDIKDTVRHAVSQIAKFEELDVEVEVL